MAKKHEIMEVVNSTASGHRSFYSLAMNFLFNCRAMVSAPAKSLRIERETDIEFEIEASRVHWSDCESTLRSNNEEEAAHLTNAEIVASLQRQWPDTGDFFRYNGDDLKVGAKIAEGGQAEIFEAHFPHINDSVRCDMVLKVFKDHFSINDLQKQWPQGMLEQIRDFYGYRYESPILSGTVVMNGRFAFQMFKRWGDLRKLIDLRVEKDSLLSESELERNMLGIALGVQALHKDNIVHRDLKASNILINANLHLTNNPHFDPTKDSYTCEVADYECSVGVVGTRFWRAPEILQAVKNRNINSKLFTSKSDVYSYGMICYEMITGLLPFHDLNGCDYDTVIAGRRPCLPKHTKSWIKRLLKRCWYQNPSERPSFAEIVRIVNSHSRKGSELVRATSAE